LLAAIETTNEKKINILGDSSCSLLLQALVEGILEIEIAHIGNKKITIELGYSLTFA
jgi:hypothetical protein